MASPPQSHETRDLLLRAAGPIFAKHGFHATTVRQITQAAGVNLAAINYHFRDKQELYVQVLIHAHQASAKMSEASISGTPEERLEAFIHKFLGYLLDPKRPEWHGQLLAREMAQPSKALDRLVEESIKPVKGRIYAIVHDILGENVPRSSMQRACFSIIGQCLYYVHCREMMVRLFPSERGVPHDIKALAEHIFQFSLAGLRSLRQSESKAARHSISSPTPRRKSP